MYDNNVLVKSVHVNVLKERESNHWVVAFLIEPYPSFLLSGKCVVIFGTTNDAVWLSSTLLLAIRSKIDMDQFLTV